MLRKEIVADKIVVSGITERITVLFIENTIRCNGL